MAVVVNSGPITATQSITEVPRDKWKELVRVRRDFLSISLSYDCRCLVQFVNDAKKIWKACGYKSAADLISDGYGLEPAEIQIALKWLELNPPDDPIPYQEVIELAKHGRPKKGEEKASNRSLKFGTTREYQLARLKRDAPGVLERLQRGEYRSVRAAAIDAGIVKVDTPLVLLKRAWARASQTEQEEFIQWMRRTIAA